MRPRRGAAQPLLIVARSEKAFPGQGRLVRSAATQVQAVDGVSFSVAKGQTLGIVGESGCGKSTTARLLLHLIEPDAGEIIFDGEAVGAPRGICVRDSAAQCRWCFRTAIRR